MGSPAKSSQRLVAAMCYLFTPVAPLVALRDREDDPFVARHARQGLMWALPFFILLGIMIFGMVLAVQADLLFICLLPVTFLLPFLPGAYWAKRVYFGGDVKFSVGSGSRQGE